MEPGRKKALDRYRLTEKYQAKQQKYLESEKGADYLAKKRQRHRKRRLVKETAGTLTEYEWRVITHAFRRTCAYCGKKTRTTGDIKHPDHLTMDHIIPLSKGGTHTRDNVTIACEECNQRKGNDQDGWVPRPPIGKLKF